MKDVFAIQSGVAERVAAALQVQLLSSVRKRIEKALKYFELALLADPNFARPP
jgi:hypothetical protein